MASRLRVVVLGLGDIGSAVAHRLFRDGSEVVIQDGPMPTTTRRRMAFADAVFDGWATLDGIEARRASDFDGVRRLLDAGHAIPVSVGERSALGALLHRFDVHVLVDARMRKHAQPEVVRGLAPLTIGLGPGFEVGRICDLAVETSWGQLGAVIYDGAPLPLAGEPRAIDGHARERYVYAPFDGVFRTRRNIGDVIEAGQAIAMVDNTVLEAPVGGVVRGLTRDGVPVTVRTKVIEIDPRGLAGEVAGIGERPRRIAEGVTAAIASQPGQRCLGLAN